MNSSKSQTLIIALLLLAVAGIGVFAWRQRDELSALRNSKVSEKDMAALRDGLMRMSAKLLRLEDAACVEADGNVASATPLPSVMGLPAWRRPRGRCHRERLGKR